MNKPHSKGFTLVEMVVSLAIFAIVATVALGALVRIVDANKKAQTLQSAITNLNFTLDSISRELRVGSTYKCIASGSILYTGGDFQSVACPLGTNKAIMFHSSAHSGTEPLNSCNLVYAYKFDAQGTTPETYKVSKATQKNCSDQIDDSSFTPIIPSNVIISSYRLGVMQSDLSHLYPLAVVRISGYVGVREKERTYFDVQTADSSRLP